MSEIEHQERDRRSEVDAGDAAGARDGAGGVVSTLAQMVRAGARSPADVAKFLQAHPAQRRELVSALHQVMGNGFVQNVLSLVGMRSAPAAPAAMHEPSPAAPSPAAPSPELAHSPAPASVPLGQVRVTSHGLHVRSSAARAPDNIIATLARHEVVTAVGRNGAWMQITHGDTPAFVFAEFVEAVANDGAAAPAAPATAPVAATPPPPTVATAPTPAAPTPTHEAHPAHVEPAPVSPKPPAETPGPAAPHPAPVATAGPAATPHIEAPHAAPDVEAPAAPAPAPVVTPVVQVPPKTPTAPATAKPAPAPAPTPAATPTKPQEAHTNDDAHHEVPAAHSPSITQGPAAGKPPAPEQTPEAERVEPHVYTVGSGDSEQKVLVYVSPGKLTNTPNVFMFLHGYDADYGIDPAQKGRDKNAVISGADIAAEAMSRARDKNTITILPQGIIGRQPSKEHKQDRKDEGGHMKGLEKPGSLPTFIQDVLNQAANDIPIDRLPEHKLAVGHLSLAGHSAGGYQGIQSALSHAGSLEDKITDVTLMDSDYSSSHYATTQAWMFKGSPGKTVRIVETPTQFHDSQRAFWRQYFDKSQLAGAAKQHGFTLEHDSEGDKRGAYMTVAQHTRLMKDGQNHCDILILSYDKTHNELRDHHPLRDEVMDDSVLSIDEGAAGNATYGKRDHGVMKDSPASPAQPVKTSTSRETHDETVAPPHPAAAHDAAPKPKPAPEPTPDVKAKADEHAATEPKPADATQAQDHTPQKAGEKPKAFIPATRDVYKTGGKLNHDKLHAFGLDEKQYEFKQKVYDKVTSRLGDHIYGGVAAEDLRDIDGGQKIRKDVVPHIQELLGAMRTAIKSGEQATGPKGKIPVGNVTGMTIASGYRSPEYDMKLWDSQFKHTFDQTAKVREATGDPLGEKAMEAFIDVFKWKKAPPGGSNHSNGNAVDLQVLIKGGDGIVHNTYDDQSGWHASWAFWWLKEHAKEFGFKNYIKEAWHWEWYA